MEIREKLYRNCEVQPSGCILWMGALDDNGYGRIQHEGKLCYTHRISYALHYGEIPNKLMVRHMNACPKSCCNPKHLKLGTMADNAMDSKTYSYDIKGKLPIGVAYNMNYDRFVARIWSFGKPVYIGIFDTIEEASEAYALAHQDLHLC